MDYKILEVHIEAECNHAVIIVAIESSPGRFKVYRGDRLLSLEEVSTHEIIDAAKYGRKLSSDEAKMYFPRLFDRNFKYEG